MKLVIGLCVAILTYYYYKKREYQRSVLSKSVIIPKLLQQSAQWVAASEQETDPLSALIHATYAVGYLSALRKIVSDPEIRAVSGVDGSEMMTAVQQVQDRAITRFDRLE